MEVATTNNHNQNHHHHHLYPHSTHTTQRSSSNALSTSSSAAGGGSRSPFQREVREWQRIDPDTGALLTGRLEADRWHNGPLNSYGKISDSQNISQPNGTQHTQRKQLEVLQARTANGAMQVIRAQTVQKTSSRWSSSSTKTTVETPTIIKAANNGCDSLFHNPHYNDHSLSHSHFHKPLQHNTAETNISNNSTRWLQLPSSTVDICEISDDDADDDDDDSVDDDHDDIDVNHHNLDDNDEFFDIETDEDQQHYLINDSCGASDVSSNSLLNRHSFNNFNKNDSPSSGRRSNSEQQLQKHSSSNFNSNNCNTLLLDTAPSLKLSNLMKSSSSISSNNSSSNNSIIGTTVTATPSSATTTINTHKNASKISLHAIVGNSNNNNSKSSSSTSAQPPATVTSAKTTSWQQQQRSSRHFEQPTLYGNINNSLTKSRVGGGGSLAGDAAASSAADDLRHHHHHHHHLHQSDELTPTQVNRQQQQQQSPPRRDLESFRHHDHGSFAASSAKNRIDHLHDDDNNDIAADDDDMRLTTRHQRRQQKPFSATTSTTSLQRSRSISTDDLSTEWDTYGGAAGEEEPGEWRRVSKLRRSFQSTTTTSTGNDKFDSSPRSTRRPLDLPTNSVSVSKIRAELENGRRLNTAMRNNHVDLAALDTILNGPAVTEAKQSETAKQTSFLTAESLKEIRGRLKKLSDESLYKEDFLTYQQLPAADEQIVEVQHVKSVPQTPERRLRQLTPEQSPEISTPPKSAFHAVARQQHTAVTPHSSNYQTQRSLPTGGTTREKQHTTNSLESRQKYRDTTSAEWHIRRKSYGFEKMSPPDDKTMFRMDASTDSGLGRSGELGNWSPTDSSPAVRGTVIHFGEPARTVSNANSLVQKRYRQLKSPEDLPEGDEEVHKRHSIAVDESQYVRDNLRKTSQVHLNGFYDTETSKSLQTETTTAAALFQRTQQKRVEFCKTEVHFAAESGRVNIVETDGKPPPTNNFRRRRRTSSGPLQSLVKSASTVSSSSSSSSISSISSSVALPITHFGDDHHRRKTIATTMVAYKASLVDTPENSVNNALELSPSTNVTVSVVPKLTETFTLAQESSRNSYASTSGIDSTTDGENDEISAIRGILKNKPIKPKPYHLGENIDSADALWGVQLKPIGAGSGAGTTALINRHDSVTPKFVSDPSKPDSPISSGASNKSVAERVRIVEKRQDLTTANGYSTKINLSLDEKMHMDWTEPGAVTETNLFERRPSAQELLLQDLREHQRILGEGLKSTSLIIKTMRSATEFDEAMRRLSIASMEAAVIPPIVVPTPMIRSNSYQETTRRYSTTSLDGNSSSNSNERATVGIIKSASCSSSTSTSTTSTFSTMRRFSTESYSTLVPQPPIPVAAPRLKLLGNTEIPVSQQLSQLRRMYEVAAAQQNDCDDDSADEEVKSYFRGHDNSDSGDATQESSSLEDERAVEYSSSWSRLKAKRTIWKIEGNDVKPAAKMLERTELPKSNVMSIELHSPQQAMLDKQQNAINAGAHLQRTQTPPVARPRSNANAKQTEHPQIHTATTVKQQTNHHKLQHLHQQQSTIEPTKDSLKIVKEARGARKLREHELSYFGVPISKTDIANAANNEMKTTPKILSTNTPKRTLPQRKYIEEQTMNDLSRENQTTKWQLLNDKPDLLRHSPIAVEPQVITRTADIKQQTRKIPRSPIKAFESEDEEIEDDDDSENIDDHLYENIANEITPVFKVKSSHSYDRKMDLKRDALILSEMTKNADQTMKALSDEAAIKDQRRRSLQRRNSKPLETIEEKGIAEKINDTCIAVKVSRSTLASEAKRTARCSNTPSPTTVGGGTGRVRTSSQSSTESCPRARSRSLSSEREYENVKVVRPAAQRSSSANTKPSTTTAKLLKKPSSRSNSLESRHATHTIQYSSGDEICKRNEERLRAKTKRVSSSSASRGSRGDKRSSKDERGDARKVKHHHQSLKDGDGLGNEKQQQLLHRGSTTHSSQRERIECSKPQHHHHYHHRSSSGGGSSRRRKDEHDALPKSIGRSSAAAVVAVATGSRDEKRTGHTSRLVRSAHVLGHERDSVNRSSHRSERSEKALEKEKEKEKLSRSKGHSSHPTTVQTNERQHHTSSPHGITDTKKLLREHKSKSTTTTKATPSSDNITHSKNAQIINGQHDDGHQREHRSQSHHHQQQQQHQHAHHQQHHHSHPTTTTTIAAKHRSERHGKDRK